MPIDVDKKIHRNYIYGYINFLKIISLNTKLLFPKLY
jgi:hypothetical protein